MRKIEEQLDRINSICHIPMILLTGEGEIVASWPKSQSAGVYPFAYKVVIEDFRLQKRDSQHPLISYLGSGFLLGVMQLSQELYLLIGLVSPHHQTRKDILKMVENVAQPLQLQSLCDYLLQTPLMPLDQLKAYICLLSKLLLPQEILEGNILFVDIVTSSMHEPQVLEKNLFEQREEPEFHVPVDFETAICSAIEAGNRTQLERSLYTPAQGRIGRMSSNDLRQQKYTYISMATLASRAAIRGGLPAEIAFSLSDLYCQRIDLISEVQLIQNLVYTMLVDYCERVREIQKRPVTSSVISNCLSYITVHLHEPINLEQLSQHCGLCTRSLSLRFKKEMGMGIPEYIHREKLQEAEYLLLHTGYSLSEITSYLNYPSQSYFTEIFKKYNHMTPQQFRDKRK